MKLSEFKRHLQQSPKHELLFVLPDGSHIEAHAHITEVGRVEKNFIDCGGTIRRSVHCSLQAWVADDLEHRLAPGALAGILDKARPILGEEDLDVEIEYQDGVISQFPVETATQMDGELLFHLSLKNTDCLAKDVCLTAEADSGCCGGGKCC